LRFVYPQRREATAGFETYKNAFPHARLTRSPKGVCEVVFHTSGGTLVFNGDSHEEFVELFHQRYTRVALTQNLRRIVDESVGYGLALEGISAADVARSQVPEKDPQRQAGRSDFLRHDSPVEDPQKGGKQWQPVPWSRKSA
jgi:hypothetical protein